MNKTQNKPKNFDYIYAQDYERYMQSGIIEFRAVIEFGTQDNNKIHELADKYGYLAASSAYANVYEMIKRGATFEDRTRQIQNENLSLY